MRKSFKKFLSLITAMLMIVSLLPSSVYAYYGSDETVDRKSVYYVGETDIPDDAVVYISISNDDTYVVSDGQIADTVMAYVPVKISDLASVDLEAYDLQDYLFEDSENAGKYYITLMHLFVYVSEQYYEGGWDVTVTGSAGSSYMQNGFWGHDENLTYNVNGEYPLAAPAWGATSDQIILESGDFADVSMYSDWSFYTDPNAGYHYFLDDKGAVTHAYEAEAGQTVTMTYGRSKTDFGGDYTTSYQPCAGEIYITKDLSKNPADDASAVVVEAGANGEFSYRFPSAGTYYLMTYGSEGEGGAIVSAPAYAVVNVDQKPEVRLSATIRSQYFGAYFAPFAEELNISSLAAENYGYADEIEGVSALDALVTAHEAAFEEAFTPDTKDDFLAVSSSGFVTKLFGVETSANGFLVNGGYPNDGTESSWGGYNGTTVTTTELVDGDVVDFILYSDDTYYSDYYSYLTVPEIVAAGEEFEASVSGVMFMMGYLYENAEDMADAAEALEDAEMAWVDPESGEVTLIEDSLTDEDGKVSLTAPEEPGVYYLTATNNSDLFPCVLMNPAAVTVVKPEKAAVNARVQMDGVYLNDYSDILDVDSLKAERYGYTDSVDGVSALDVMVALHEVVFGSDFTAETAENYLVVSDGFVGTLFGEVTMANGFLVNEGYPNDGTESQWGGYNGTTVTTTRVEDGDRVEFYTFGDTTYWSDIYSYIEVPENANINSEIEVTVKGTAVMAGYAYKTPEDMKAAAEAVEDAMLAWIDRESGEITVIEGVKTDEDGKASIKMPEVSDTYYLTAVSNSDDDVYILMNPVALNVTEDTEGFYTITVNAVPATANVVFYSGADADVKVAGGRVKDMGVTEDGKYHQYVLTVPEGTYSYRAADGDISLGGMSFDVPIAENVTSSDSNTTMTLVRVNYYDSKNLVKEIGEYSLAIYNGPNTVEVGNQFIDASNRVVTSAMLWAYGNAQLYNWIITLHGSLSESYGVTPAINQTFAATLTAAQNKTFAPAALKTFTLNAPTDADSVSFYYQINNFNDMYLEPSSITENEDGTTTYVIQYPAFANVSYRVSKEGKMTEAGYAKDNTTVTAAFSDASPKTEESALNYDDRSVLLNIDDSKKTNELALQVGESYRVRAYRAAWEIVNTTTANIMIEPDFHYEILSGDDVIAIEPVTDRCTGNASGNWLDVTALKEGTAIVAVTYDAVEINGTTGFNGVYGASDPTRSGVFVVNVGQDASIDIEPVSADGNWDAEFDTVYYFGDKGTFSFAADDASSVSVRNVFGSTLGAAISGSLVSGKWQVPVTDGANVIAITGAEGTDYMVVRAKKISYTITNNTQGISVENSTKIHINKGDSVTVSFDGLNMPVPKMSGIYNPGYGSTLKTTYSLNGDYVLQSSGTQYNYILPEKSSITFTAYVAGNNVLDSGCISLTSMGDAFGNHRNTSDGGRGTNFNASAVADKCGTLPALTLNVKDSDAEAPVSDQVAVSKIALYGGTSSYMSGFSFTSAKTTGNYASWTKTTDVMSAYKLAATVTTKSYYNKITMTYWYDGEEKTTIDLASGVETFAPNFPLEAEKVLNVEIKVAPAAGSDADSVYYNFVVTPGNASLKYVHPYISALTAVDADGSELSISADGKEGIRLGQTDYELMIDKAESVVLSGKMIQKYTNATNKNQDNSDEVVLYGMKNGERVGEGVVLQTGHDYPKGSWTSEAIDISELDALQIVVTSYVDDSTATTYNISLVSSCIDGGKHVWSEEYTIDVPACQADGYESKHCTICGAEGEGHALDRIDHMDEDGDQLCDTCGSALRVQAVLSGSSRWETSAKLAAAAYPTAPDEIIVVSGEDFPDALSANALAGSLDAPIILTKKNSLPDAIKTLLTETWEGAVSKATVIGGGITNGVLVELSECGIENINISLTRGANRYQTAELVCRYGIDNGLMSTDTVVLATGKKAADALSVSAWSYGYRIPILLVKDKDKMTTATQEMISEFKNVIVLGGAVSKEYLNTLDINAGHDVYLAGGDRYETSMLIADYFMEQYGGTMENVSLAKGKDANFADALLGGMWAGKNVTPLLLVSEKSNDVYEYLGKNEDLSMVSVLGAAANETIEGAITEATGIKPVLDYQEVYAQGILCGSNPKG